MWWIWWILGALSAIAFVYWFIICPYNYWLAKGVKQGKPLYVFGDIWGTITKQQSFSEMVEMLYNMRPNTRYFGSYQFFSPSLMIRDPELIKRITVKDFDHFVDHRSFVPEDCDFLWAGNLFSLCGEKWRTMRTTLSPVFTSSKMKYMFPLISQSGQQFVNYFTKQDQDIITLEMKDTFTRFTNDIIANTAFGIECDSLKERDNEFYVMGKEATDFSGFWKNFKIFGYSFFPVIFGKLLKVSLFSQELSDFFIRLVKNNIESRQKHGIVRPDLIHLLLEARKNGLKHEETHEINDVGFAVVEESKVTKSQKMSKVEITDQAITAQALVFFFAGFDSVSSLMCFMSYELGINPDVQRRLIQEVDETREACNGKLNYEAVTGMKYMDKVVSETLRKWPISIVVERICTKPYTIEPKYPDEKPVHLEKNALVWLPVFAIHRDPQYYPEPDRFDPERFNNQNKRNIIPYTYLPFGSGPRNCIGSRFALLETKTIFFYILTHFEIVPVNKTQIPLKTSKRQSNLGAEGGFWLGLKRRIKT